MQTLSRKRAGKVSSSESYKMFESPAIQKSYSEDVKISNLFQQADPEKEVFNFKWGHLCENFLHDATDYLDGYVNQNKEDDATIFSEVNPLHCGTPDQFKVIDNLLLSSETKSPVTLKGLYNLIFPFYSAGKFVEIDGNEAIAQIVAKSKEGRKYYKQIISNAILLEEKYATECNMGELIAYMPYKKDIKKLLEYAEDFFVPLPYFAIQTGTSESLPCIKSLEKDETDFDDLDDTYPVRDFHRIRFDISAAEKENFKKTLNAFTSKIV